MGSCQPVAAVQISLYCSYFNVSYAITHTHTDSRDDKANRNDAVML